MTSHPHRWRILAVVATAFFMTILDIAIVNVALPSPGYLMVGVGIAFAFVPVSIAALAGVVEREAGLASGLINTSQQIGGAVGVAVASTVFTTHFKSLTADGKPLADALTGGYAWGFWALAVFAALAFLAVLTLIKREEMAGAPASAPASS